MEVSEYLVGSPAFKAGDTGDPRMAGSIPVHLRKTPPSEEIYGGLPVLYYIAVTIFLLFLLVPESVGAQARLLSSSPEDGANLSNLEEVTFEFDLLLVPEGAAVRVLRLDGTEIPVAAVVVDRTLLTATLEGQLTSGNYEVSYAVESSDGRLNEGSIRVSVASPDQALSGGLLAVVGLGIGMFGVMFLSLIHI